MTNLVFRRPPQEFDAVFDSLVNDFFNSVSRTPFVKQAQKASYPRIDIRDNRESAIIDATVPGLKKEEITIKYEEGLLSISADKQASPDDGAWLHKEIHRSSFLRSFSVDEKTFDVGKITADLEDGILSIIIPKKDEKIPPLPKEIKIN